MIERLWGGRAPQREVLGGGITNHNVKVTLDDGSAYVLRVAGKDTALLGIDRYVEHEASLAAAAVGVGPEVVAFVEPEGYLVTRFIEGSIVPMESMTDPACSAGSPHALRAIHAGPPLPRRFDSFGIVEDYRSIAFARGSEVPPEYATARQIARTIERRARADPRAALSQRSAQRELHRRWLEDPHRRLGVRGDG